MEGFSKSLAVESGQTECSFDLFGDPAIGQDKHCWCQRWVEPGQQRLKIGKCYNFGSDFNEENYFKNTNGDISVEPQDFDDEIYKKDATWKVVQGNFEEYPEAISFQSISHPTNFINAPDKVANVKTIDGVEDQKSSSFYVVDMGDLGIQIESALNDGRFFSENNSTHTLQTKSDDNSADYQSLSTWKPIEVACQ